MLNGSLWVGSTVEYLCPQEKKNTQWCSFFTPLLRVLVRQALGCPLAYNALPVLCGSPLISQKQWCKLNCVHTFQLTTTCLLPSNLYCYLLESCLYHFPHNVWCNINLSLLSLHFSHCPISTLAFCPLLNMQYIPRITFFCYYLIAFSCNPMKEPRPTTTKELKLPEWGGLHCIFWHRFSVLMLFSQTACIFKLYVSVPFIVLYPLHELI